MEMHTEMHAPHLTNHSLFRAFGKTTPLVIRKLCHTGVFEESLTLGDNVFSDGEVCDRMYFLTHGIFVYNIGQDMTEQVDAGKRNVWYCEASLWTVWMTVGCLTSLSRKLTFLAMPAEKFHHVVQTSPSALIQPSKYASSFVQFLNANGGQITDRCEEFDTDAAVKGCMTEDVSNMSEGSPRKNNGTTAAWSTITGDVMASAPSVHALEEP